MQEHVALHVASKDIAPGHDVENAQPAMRMHRVTFARLDPCVENSYSIVLKENLVILGAAAIASRELGHEVVPTLPFQSTTMPPPPYRRPPADPTGPAVGLAL